MASMNAANPLFPQPLPSLALRWRSGSRKWNSVMPECKTCGESLPVVKATQGRPRKFCKKPSCKREANRVSHLSRRIRQRASASASVCRNCGTAFTHLRRRIYCSASCMTTFYRENQVKAHLLNKICATCGIIFTTKIQTEKTCSKECQRKHHALVDLTSTRRKQAELRDAIVASRLGLPVDIAMPLIPAMRARLLIKRELKRRTKHVNV